MLPVPALMSFVWIPKKCPSFKRQEPGSRRLEMNSIGVLMPVACSDSE